MKPTYICIVKQRDGDETRTLGVFADWPAVIAAFDGLDATAYTYDARLVPYVEVWVLGPSTQEQPYCKINMTLESKLTVPRNFVTPSGQVESSD
jgi:hypothetical protein